MRKKRRLLEGQQSENMASSPDPVDVPTEGRPDSGGGSESESPAALEEALEQSEEFVESEGPAESEEDSESETRPKFPDSFPLHTAVLTRSLPLIKSVIASGPYINSRINKRHRFQTPLHLLFVLATHVPEGESCWEEDPYFDDSDDKCLYGDPSKTSTIPLGVESKVEREKVDMEIFDLLVGAGADVLAKDLDGNSVLHLVAARNGAKWMVDRILAKGGKIDETLEVEDGERARWEAEVAEAVKAAGGDIEGLDDGPPGCGCNMQNMLRGLLSSLSDERFAKEGKQNDAGSTALHLACKNGRDEMVEALLSAGADFRVQDDDQNTALNLAVTKSHDVNAGRILAEMDRRGWTQSEKKEFIESEGQFDEPIIFHAVRLGRLPIVESILKHNPNLARLGLHGKTILRFANKSTLPILLPLVRDVMVPVVVIGYETDEEIGRESAGREEIFVPILEQLDIKDHTTVLGEFYSKGDLESMLLLLDAGASLHNAAKDEMGWTPIHKAARDGRTQFLQAFVEQFMSPDSKLASYYILQDASPERREEELKALLNAKGPDHLTPLMYAVTPMRKFTKQFEGAQCLLTFKSQISPGEFLVDVNARGADSQATALHIAVITAPGPDIVDLLVAAGADVNAQSDDGFTPLHNAAAYGGGFKWDDSVCSTVVRALIRCGADVEAFIEGDGRRPLHMACFKGRFASVKELLVQIPGKDPIDLVSKDVRDWTPLHFAVFYGHEEVTGLILDAAKSRSAEVLESLLLAQIAADDPTGHGGGTALHLAGPRKHAEIVERILKDCKWGTLGERNFLQSLLAVKDAMGCTPVERASFAGDENIMRILEKAI